ncbi:unnamed protein product [Adineta ricciae]|uniref:Coiled-coil domain-containing protein 13 n=1 Tax=Adineta ricciae TaxID=249248 RepID=A0A814NQW4_ADIRI|nr:unnamed protein product [Adineta ricciae]CAF1469633.1 unnamed protein product [Adineta ricciae]
MSSGDTVREQFSALQRQQKERLHQLQEKSTKKKVSTVDTSDSINYEVDSGPFPIEESNNVIASIIAVQQENQSEQLRELRDENGRLRKLLAEKDYEIDYLRRIQEEERQAFTGPNTVGGDAIATKVVELSKKNRELSAELESERAKLKKLSIKCKELESLTTNVQTDGPHPAISADENKTEKELKELRDKFKDLQARHTEAKSQLDITKQELKKTQKALEKEVGDTVNIQNILNGTSNWRGRQQQIIALQEKVNELKARTNSGTSSGMIDDWEGSLLASKYDETMSNAQQRHRDEIRRIERERKDSYEQQKQELQVLRAEHQTLKDKFDQSKSRNTVLANEVKTLREQLKTSLEKSKHDDELIEVLLKQQQQLKSTHDHLQKDLEVKSKISTELEQTTKLDQMKQANMIKQLQLILDQKEMRIRELEMHLDENRIKYERERSEPRLSQTKLNDSLPFVNITSRHTPIQSVTLPPVQLTALKQSTSVDPVINRLEKSGFSTASNSRPASAATFKRSSDDKDLQCINAALEVERNRLVEFVQTLQKRLDTANAQHVEQENKIIEYRRMNVRLEKDMEKVKLDLNNVKNRTVKGRGAVSLPKSASTQGENHETIEELETRLALKTEENDALKNALQSMLDAKEEDLKLYNETIQSVKDIFLQGIQHYKPLQTTD